MEKNIEKVLLTEEQIQNKVDELAAILSKEYADKDPVFIGVLKGVVIFFADMVRKITAPCHLILCLKYRVASGIALGCTGYIGSCL